MGRWLYLRAFGFEMFTEYTPELPAGQLVEYEVSHYGEGRRELLVWLGHLRVSMARTHCPAGTRPVLEGGVSA